MQEGVDAGILKASSHPRERAALLTLWSIGAVVLHEHAERLLGIDLLGDWHETPEAMNYVAPAFEMFAQGLMTEAAAERMRSAFESAATPEDQEEPPS